MKKLLNKSELPLNIGDIYFKCIEDHNNDYEVLNSGYIVGINKDSGKKGVLWFSMRSNGEIWQYQDQKLEDIRDSYKYWCTNIKEYDLRACYALKDYILNIPQTLSSLIYELNKKHPKISYRTNIYIKNKNDDYDIFKGRKYINDDLKYKKVNNWRFSEKGNLLIELED